MHDRPVVSGSDECQKRQKILIAFAAQNIRQQHLRALGLDGSTKITTAAANIQSSMSLPGAGQSIGVLIAARLS
jgi:hypothetical protein